MIGTKAGFVLFFLLLGPTVTRAQDQYDDSADYESIIVPAITGLESTDVDIGYLNETFPQFVAMAEDGVFLTDEDEEDQCPIDTILEQIFPNTYEVATDFDLNQATQVEHINQTFDIVHHLMQLATNYSQLFAPLAQRVAGEMYFLLYELQLSPECMSSVTRVVRAIQNRELWAFKFIDASGRVPNGLLEGVLSSVGDYGECLRIESPTTADEQGTPFGGKFCFAKPVLPHPPRHTYHPGDRVEHSFGIPRSLMDEVVDFLHLINGSLINIGLCVPSTCSAKEIETTLNRILYPITKIPVQIGPECSTKAQPVVLDNYQVMALVVFSALFSLAIVSSLYEWAFIEHNMMDKLSLSKTKKNEEEVAIEMENKLNSTNSDHNENCKLESQSGKLSSVSLTERIIQSFSLLYNTRQMFQVVPNKFGSIDFIRFVMLVEIMLMHQYYVAMGWSAWPLSKRFVNGLFQRVGTEFKYGFLRNIHNTDFFFALTGLLLSYSTMRALDRSQGRFNYWKFALSMYLRFYPAVFGTILMFYLLPLFGDGPFWHLVDSYHVQSCRTNLLANMFTYNFYVLDLETFVRHSMCNIASWWVTSCFHLILLSPLLLLPLYYSPRAISLVLVTIVAGCGLSVSHILLKGIPFMSQITQMNAIFEEAFYSIFYTWPFIHHISPFCLGILVGYLIKRYPNIHLGGAFGETLLTVAFVSMSAFGFYWTQDMLKSSVDLADVSMANAARPGEPLEIYLNITVGKLLFCVGFMWIFYLCCTKRSETLSRLLTLPGLQPLYSLSLGLYLTNFIPPLYTVYSTREVIEFTDFYIMKNFAFNFSLTVILSYILHVLFERPVLNLLRIVES